LFDQGISTDAGRSLIDLFDSSTTQLEMLLSTALSIVFLVLGVNGQRLPQTVFNSSNLGDEAHIITPEFSKYVEEIINITNVPGLSLAVVRKDGNPELAAWGGRTEDGAATTSKVCSVLVGMCDLINPSLIFV